MWIVISGFGTWDCWAGRFNSRKEAIAYMNTLHEPEKLILAKQEQVKLELDKGTIVVK